MGLAIYFPPFCFSFALIRQSITEVFYNLVRGYDILSGNSSKMTNSCAVPTCDTGRKAIKEKRSTFKVPTDIELRNKWTAAIPGILQLMPWQFVCEKHFLECYIRRKWTKYDDNGRVIAEVSISRAFSFRSTCHSSFNGSCNFLYRVAYRMYQTLCMSFQGALHTR